MELRVLGRTGMSVSKFCFGAGMFGYFGGVDEAAARELLTLAARHRPGERWTIRGFEQR